METEPIDNDQMRSSSPMLLSPSSSSSQVISTQFKTTMDKKKKSSESSNADNSMALSLHVLDLDDGEEEPLPLEVYGPSEIEFSKRRSSRFTTNKCRSGSQEQSSEKEIAALSFSISITPEINLLRRSPRFPSAEIVEIDGKLGENEAQFFVGSNKRKGSALSGSQNGSNFKKVKFGLREKGSQKMWLRRSPRLQNDSDCAENGNSEGSLLALTGSEKGSSRKHNLIEKFLSKSSRLYPSSAKVELLALQERVSSASRKCNSREDCLRKSPRLNPACTGDKNGSSSSESLALPASPAKLEKRDSQKQVLSVKSLRSRTIQMHVGKKDQENMVKRDSKKIGCVDGSKKSLRSRKIEFELPNDSPKNALKESTSRGRNVIEKCSKSRKIDASQNCAMKKSTSEGREPKKMTLGKNTIKVKTFEGIDLNKESSPENMELNLLEERHEGKCESDVFSERCLRNRKVAFKTVAGENDDQKPHSVNGEIPKDGESATKSIKSNSKNIKHKYVSRFIGEPIPEDEAQKRWNWRYELKVVIILPFIFVILLAFEFG